MGGGLATAIPSHTRHHGTSMRRSFLSLLLAAAIAGCGGSTSPKSNVNGSWSGSSGGISMSLTLSQSGTSVTGSGQISGGGNTIPLTASGTYVEPDLSLTLSSAGFQPTVYAGSLSHGTITGTLNGSGFTNQSMTLTRQ